MSKLSDIYDALSPAADEDGHTITQKVYDAIVAALALSEQKRQEAEERRENAEEKLRGVCNMEAITSAAIKAQEVAESQLSVCKEALRGLFEDCDGPECLIPPRWEAMKAASLVLSSLPSIASKRDAVVEAAVAQEEAFRAGVELEHYMLVTYRTNAAVIALKEP